MSWEVIRTTASKLKCNQRPSPRPHKPLLLLYALARWRSGNAQLRFSEHMEEFDRLVRDCGTDSERGCLDDPFWLLYKTEQVLWEVTWDGPYNGERRDPQIARADSKDWRPGTDNLVAWNARGGFPATMQRILTDEPSRLEELAEVLLVQKYFPNGDMGEIRSHIGL